MRILILGIDALEYDLVEKWDLKHLKQKEYGKTIVPITGAEPATLIVWTSFITGKMPPDFGYGGLMIYKQPLKFLLEKFYFSREPEEHDTMLESRNTKRKILDFISLGLMKVGLAERPKRKDIKVPTIFDNPGCHHFHIPVYDSDAFPSYRKYTATEAFENPEFRPVYEKGCKEEFKTRTQDVLDHIKYMENWKLQMHYFFLLDGIQHVFFKNKIRILDYYLQFNRFVGELKKVLPKDVMLLIISDHGQKKGIHTKHGFYSCNKKLKLKNPKITDFKDIIEEKIK